MPIQIRRLTINEYEAITQLWKRAKLPFKLDGRDSRESISKEIAANPDFYLGAFEQDRLVGLVILTCDMRKGWINRSAIDPEYRSQGVAIALIFKSERILRTRGVRIFCALIEADNIPSKELFKKCGYTECRDITYFSKRDNEAV